MGKPAKLILGGFAAILLLTLGLHALGAWAMSPYHGGDWRSPKPALQIAQAPFAKGIVLGDSRVAALQSTDETMFIGYSGIMITQMERMTEVVCSVSDAPVVIALGINDAIYRPDDMASSIASLERMVQGCLPSPVTIAQIWPPEPGKPTLGDAPSLQAITELDAAIGALAEQEGVEVIPVPDLANHTTDGVHFTPEVSTLFAQTLATAAR